MYCTSRNYVKTIHKAPRRYRYSSNYQLAGSNTVSRTDILVLQRVLCTSVFSVPRSNAADRTRASSASNKTFNIKHDFYISEHHQFELLFESRLQLLTVESSLEEFRRFLVFSVLLPPHHQEEELASLAVSSDSTSDDTSVLLSSGKYFAFTNSCCFESSFLQKLPFYT